MSFYVFANLALAQACAPIVDQSLGYPRAGVEDDRGGFHAKDAGGGPFVTQTYAVPAQHPTLSGHYVYPADGVTQPILSVGPNAVTLGAPTAVSFPNLA